MTTPLLTYRIGALALPNATIELIRTIVFGMTALNGMSHQYRRCSTFVVN